MNSKAESINERSNMFTALIQHNYVFKFTMLRNVSATSKKNTKYVNQTD